MGSQCPWENSELTLADLAELAGTSPHKVSEVLNARPGQTFYDFVNGYRVREVQRCIERDKARAPTLLARKRGSHRSRPSTKLGSSRTQFAFRFNLSIIHSSQIGPRALVPTEVGAPQVPRDSGKGYDRVSETQMLGQSRLRAHRTSTLIDISVLLGRPLSEPRSDTVVTPA